MAAYPSTTEITTLEATNFNPAVSANYSIATNENPTPSSKFRGMGRALQLINNYLRYTVDRLVNNRYRVRAYRNADVTWSGLNTVKFNVENYDIDNDWDTTNGAYVVPVNGYYLVSSSITYQSGTSTELNINVVKNASIYSSGDSVVTGNAARVGVSAVVQANAGDVIEIYSFAGAVRTLLSNSSNTWVDINFIGDL